MHLGDYVSFIERITRELRLTGVKEITAVGHSFGGRVAIRLASRGFVDKIVLIDSAGLKPKVRLKHILLKYRFRLRKILGLNTERCGSVDYRNLPNVRKATFNNIIHEYQDRELALIAAPCWIFWGKKDKDTPLYMAKKLNHDIRGSGMYIVKNGGHYSYLDDYKSYLLGLTHFVKS